MGRGLARRIYKFSTWFPHELPRSWHEKWPSDLFLARASFLGSCVTMAADVAGRRAGTTSYEGTFAGARLLLSSGAAPISDGADEEIVARCRVAPTALAVARELLEAGPAGAINNIEEFYTLSLPIGLPEQLSVVVLKHREDVHPRRRAAGAAHQGRAAQAHRAREAGHPQLAWTLVARCSGGRPLPLPRGCGGLARPLTVHCYAPLTTNGRACGCRPPHARRLRVRRRLPPAARPPHARRLSVRHRLPPESKALPSRASVRRAETGVAAGRGRVVYRLCIARASPPPKSRAAACVSVSSWCVCSHDTLFSQQ